MVAGTDAKQRLIDANVLKTTIAKHDYIVRDRINSTGEGMFTVGIMQAIDEQPTIDAVPVAMIEGRINDLKKMLMDIDSDEVDNIWYLRTEIEKLTDLLEMRGERKEEKE